MVELTKKGIKAVELWEKINIQLPNYNIEKVNENTQKTPKWVHFGAGNIFRGFIAATQQKILDEGATDHGIIAVEPFDYEIIDKIYQPFENLCMLISMSHDGKMKKQIISSVSESIKANYKDNTQWTRLKEIFTNPELQMISLTITEKGYALENLDRNFLPNVIEDLKNGPSSPIHTMAITTALLYERYKCNKAPIAIVSMDNCSKNGELLQKSVIKFAEEWYKRGFVEEGFLTYLSDENIVTFPWTMIDKITPHPSPSIYQLLTELEIGNMDIIKTDKGSVVAPFVNSEAIEYLVIEDKFPNGRPPLEKSGVIFTDRETVEKAEKMKVGTCLNPLHTALAIFGCLFGYKTIAEEMKDNELVNLINKLAYNENMKVVIDPGIIKPEDFVNEVIERRFPNPFIPDTPQRIAADTSQKISVRFGKTLESYNNRKDLDINSLIYIPLVFAGWLRYLVGVDDEGNEMQISSDPQLIQLQNYLQGLSIGNLNGYKEKLRPILSNKTIFVIDLYDVCLAEKVEEMFFSMMMEEQGVRKTLQKYL